MTTRITRTVRDFVLPLEPSGSLDASLGYQLEEDAAAQGTRLHGRIQARLAKELPGLLREQAVQCSFERDDFTCLVRGRIDALLPGVQVEEIKTSFRPQALLRALERDPLHPFAQQVRMYAWMHGRDRGVAPACRIRVASLLDGAEELVEVPFDPVGFGAWAERQVDGLHARHLAVLARRAERAALGARLAFPFAAPRPGQDLLRGLVEDALANREPLLVQAPTGLGKTAAVLFPALRKALREDLRVFYLTPRNSQHGVAEAALRRLHEAGFEVRSVTLRAKEKVCPQPEVHCHPDHCPRAAGYYDRLRDSGALARLAAAGCADPTAVRAEADAHALCPFELALDAARGADVVIGDYNYALSPSSTLARFSGPEEEPRNLLLIDEAHNLPARAAEWFSPALDLVELDILRRAWPRRGERGGRGGSARGRFLRQLGRCRKLLESFAGPHREVEADQYAFAMEEQRIRDLVGTAAAEGLELAPAHPLARLHRAWAEFTSVLRERTEAHLLTWIPPGRLQLTCMDAAAHLRERFRAPAGVVGFSATLKPFAYYERMLGLEGARQAEIPSPFTAAHRCLLLVPQVSTLLRRREREAPRIAAFLSRVLALRRGNYLVCFPSFDFLERVRALLDLPGFEVLAQPRRASQDELAAILDALLARRGLVVLAVQGGSLTEGIDLPGEALIGCVVVGPPLPPWHLERRLARDHFERACGEGEAWTSTYPAMAKAIQAAGRVIRGPEERGLLAFLDPRFLEPDYRRCFPADWCAEAAVSSSILADVAAFWERA